MRRRTLGFLTVQDIAPENIVLAAHDAGFEAVGLRIAARRKTESFPHSAMGNPSRIGVIKRRLNWSDLALSNVAGPYLVPETSSDELLELADLAAELGAEKIMVVSFDDEEDRCASNLAKLCEYASERSIRVMLEPLSFSAIPNIHRANGIALKIGAGNLGLLLDPLHFSRSGHQPSDLQKPGPLPVYIFQLCDAVAGIPETAAERLQETRAGRLIPGRGALPLFEMLETLPKDIEVEFEVPLPERLGKVSTRAAIALRETNAFLSRFETWRRERQGQQPT